MENLTEEKINHLFAEKKLKALFGIDFSKYPKKIQKGLEDVEVNHNYLNKLNCLLQFLKKKV